MNLLPKMKAIKKKNSKYSKYCENGLVTGRFCFAETPAKSV